MVVSRFYVGNLFENVSELELKSLFERFGSIDKIEIKNKRDVDGNVSGTFAFVTIDNLEEGSAATIIKQCNHLKWKKQILRVQLAQESFMDRLKKEREQRQIQSQNFRSSDTFETEHNLSVKVSEKSLYDPLALVKNRVQTNQTQHVENCKQKRLYYSSSSDEDEVEKRITTKNDLSTKENSQDRNLLTIIEGFDSEFWNDCESNQPKRHQNSKALQSDSLKDDSNKRRLLSIKKRRTEIVQEKLSIKSGLGAKVDVNGSLKTKKLCSDSEEDEENHKGENKSKNILFDGNESDEEDMAERFRVRPQFEGKSGGKLLNLQSKFANDERFKIDERFREVKEKKKLKKDKSDEGMDEEDLTVEKKRNLEILGSVLGNLAIVDKKKSSSKLFKDPTKCRYDPNKKDSEALVMKKKVEDSSSSDEGEETKTVAAGVKDPQVSKSDDRYWVSKSLTSAFSAPKESGFSFGFKESKSEPGFSLLNKFGKHSAVQDSPVIDKSSKKISSLVSNPFKYDSSDTEDETEKKTVLIDPMDLFAQKLKEKAMATKTSNESFFIGIGDPRLNEGKNFFSIRVNSDELRCNHEEKRPVLAQIMKKKLRRRAKKQEKLSFDLRKVNRKGGIKKKKFAYKKSNR